MDAVSRIRSIILLSGLAFSEQVRSHFGDDFASSSVARLRLSSRLQPSMVGRHVRAVRLPGVNPGGVCRAHVASTAEETGGVAHSTPLHYLDCLFDEEPTRAALLRAAAQHRSKPSSPPPLRQGSPRHTLLSAVPRPEVAKPREVVRTQLQRAPTAGQRRLGGFFGSTSSAKGSAVPATLHSWCRKQRG